MWFSDFATVGAEMPVFFAVAGIATMGLRCMCWKTRRTEAAGRLPRARRGPDSGGHGAPCTALAIRNCTETVPKRPRRAQEYEGNRDRLGSIFYLFYFLVLAGVEFGGPGGI